MPDDLGMGRRGEEAMTVLPPESLAMRIAGMLGFRKIRWSLRRLHVPVNRSALVLEVGAGGNPYPRANVLLDGFEESVERNEKQLVNDRPFVFGLCEKLPFRDKAFDFVIASHVLEHTDDPATFLSELQRVAKAGYIETPDAFFERINPFTFHRLEVTSENNKLLIKKKTSWVADPEIVGWYEKKLKKDPAFSHYIRIFPDSQHMRFYWSDSIEYDVINPADNASWDYPLELKKRAPMQNKFKDGLRSLYLLLFRRIFSQNYRNSLIDVVDLLRCVECNHTEFTKNTDSLYCNNCHHTYPMVDGVPNMILGNLAGANQVRLRPSATRISQ